MRFQSLIQAALGVYATLLLAGCTTLYMNPVTGDGQKTQPTPIEVSNAKRTSGSFASKNPNADFSQQAPFWIDHPDGDYDPRMGNQYSLIGGSPPQKTVVPAVSSSSPTGTPGSSAAGAAATTSPMISSPPAPPPAPAPAPYRY